MITGMRWPWDRIFFSVSSPSITGISTSSSIRSGFSMAMECKADAPSAAVPATSSALSPLTTVRRRLRITAESSTIRMRVRRAEDIT